MPRFPALKTGAAAQYPAQRRLRYATETRRFLDSAEQRYQDFRTFKRSWRIELSLLTPTELASIRELFIETRGSQATFEFEDPWSGVIVSPCRFAEDRLSERLLDEGSESVTVVIEEV